MFMYEYDGRRLFSASIATYMVLVFGVSMTWGPLLAPALFLVPVLYIVAGLGGKEFMGLFRRKAFWAVIGMYAVELVPLYLHFKYARLNSAQGINASGIMTDFHYGIILLGLGYLVYLIAKQKQDRLSSLVTNSLMSFYVLLGLLVCIQYFTVGELRYYAIKTSYLVEMIVLAFLAAEFVWLCCRKGLRLANWFGMPLAFSLVVIVSLAMTANPLLPLRQTFRTYSRFGYPLYHDSDVRAYALLGQQHKLYAANNEVLHYDATTNKIFGDGLVMAAAETVQYTDDGTPASAECSGTIYKILVYGVGDPAEQPKLIDALRNCIATAHSKQQTYYVVTDTASVAKLRSLLGNDVTFVVQ
jgi:hypothetical protein